MVDGERFGKGARRSASFLQRGQVFRIDVVTSSTCRRSHSISFLVDKNSPPPVEPDRDKETGYPNQLWSFKPSRSLLRTLVY